MQPSLETPSLNKHKWIYASLRVHDGDRIIKPSHVCGTFVRFPEPPHLTSTQIEIILTNGNDVQRTLADVLPHDPDATQIPICVLQETCVNSKITD